MDDQLTKMLRNELRVLAISFKHSTQVQRWLNMFVSQTKQTSFSSAEHKNHSTRTTKKRLISIKIQLEKEYKIVHTSNNIHFWTKVTERC